MSRRAVLAVARRLPPELKELRAKLMLEPLCESLGVEEVACPACRGTGWLSELRLERCPVCCGFREVPRGLSDWFRNRLRAGLRRTPEGLRRSSSAETPAASADPERDAEPDRIAYSVSLPPPACEPAGLA